MEEKKTKKGGKAKYILLGLLGVVAVAGTAYYFISRKPKGGGDLDLNVSEVPSKAPHTSSASSGGGSPRPTSSGFPLKKGSRGQLVRNLQAALVKKYGASILPKWGIDGQWGSEVTAALVSKGFPTVIDADEFTRIVSSKKSSSSTKSSSKKKKFDPLKVSDYLHSAIEKDDFSRAMKVFGWIHTTKGYTRVNTYFKERRVNGGVRKTLVNALLSRFSSTSEKKELNSQFYRIGLKYNGRQWSLSGLGQALCDQIKAVRDTEVWNQAGKLLKVPAETVLGEFIKAKKGITKFKTLDDKILFTNTRCICYV